jgi:uncharacterized membrane protein YedE/YeeE
MPVTRTPDSPSMPAIAAAAFVLMALLGLSEVAATWPGGRQAVLALGIGTALGVVLQRSRFCLFSHARDYLDNGNAGGVLAILLALAVGTVGMHVAMGNSLTATLAGQWPAVAPVGQVSWVLALAGLAYGLGMVISGGCIAGHAYRLGEGSSAASLALIGTALGFGLGFSTWNTPYEWAVADAPRWWLPNRLGHGGSMLATLAALGVLAAWCSRRSFGAEIHRDARAKPQDLGELARRLFSPAHWPAWAGGLAVGWLFTLALLRLQPPCLTGALGSAIRRLGASTGWVPARLNGLDELGGCMTALAARPWQTPDALLVVGVLAGSFFAAAVSRQFLPALPQPRQIARALAGGVLLGWAAMTGLGCSFGTILSGIAGGAVSGWLFGAAALLAVWTGLRLKL